MEYRILEREYNDGSKAYRVETKGAFDAVWDSIIQVKSIEEARKIIDERKNRGVKAEKVIE